ncbi:hypothetical protein SAMN00120144_3968 [Hymenobacter roseosalivarius DSM 11622]|uniref:Uncharacterized protein n=1 Tax=Hymenobacter roseosalivarius DSM 11622 TaxID=645990 RepID=A0A1W1UEU5_9BACT|nr:hypothetical protein [Hymenobacter roseosalivarius]SMB79625.1 hypothetical protein SAMN00120144_3968 [Hymenobacter roseosalivarius DSM 11622]
MSSTLPRTLIKLVAKSFYREHTGLLFFLLILVFSNFFYTNVLNQTHLTPDQILATALKLVLATVRNPLGTGILFVVFLLYSLKTWQYAARRLKEPDVQFLFYSTNALRQSRQVRAWAVVQLVTSLPIIIMGAYTIVIGVMYGYWLVPLLIPVYVVILIFSGALYYVRLINQTTIETGQSPRFNWLKNRPKPLGILFLYEVVTRKKVPLGITKLVSFACVILLYQVFPAAHADIRLLGLLSLCVALSHAVLVYQSHEFEEVYLRFARNFPYSSGQVLSQQTVLYCLLLVPELVWLVAAFQLQQAMVGILLTLSVTLLFRAMLYRIGQQISYYLRFVFGLFILMLFVVLFGLTIPLAVSAALAAWALVYRHQYAD